MTRICALYVSFATLFVAMSGFADQASAGLINVKASEAVVVVEVEEEESE